METIFRELRNAYGDLAKRDNSDETKLRYDALVDLEQYIESFCWYDGNFKQKEEIEMYYKSPVKVWVKNTGRSPKNCNLILKRASDSIRDKIGYDKINKILNGTIQDVKHVRNALVVARYERWADDMIMYDALKRIRKYPCHKEYEISELKDELEFLKVFVKWTWDFNIKKLSVEKLSYIVEILNNSEGGYLDEKVKLVQYLAKNKDMHLNDV